MINNLSENAIRLRLCRLKKKEEELKTAKRLVKNLYSFNKQLLEENQQLKEKVKCQKS